MGWYAAVIVLKILQRCQKVWSCGNQPSVRLVSDSAAFGIFVRRRMVRACVANIRDHSGSALPALPDIVAVSLPRPRRKRTVNKTLLAIASSLWY